MIRRALRIRGQKTSLSEAPWRLRQIDLHILPQAPTAEAYPLPELSPVRQKGISDWPKAYGGHRPQLLISPRVYRALTCSGPLGDRDGADRSGGDSPCREFTDRGKNSCRTSKAMTSTVHQPPRVSSPARRPNSPNPGPLADPLRF
jgi:hypothetical protein